MKFLQIMSAVKQKNHENKIGRFHLRLKSRGQSLPTSLSLLIAYFLKSNLALYILKEKMDRFSFLIGALSNHKNQQKEEEKPCMQVKSS